MNLMLKSLINGSRAVAGKRSLISRDFSSTKLMFSNNSQQKNPLMLMPLPHQLVPNLFKLIKLRLEIQFKLSQVDPEFNFNEFRQGAQQAMETVSHIISRGDLEKLKGVVHDDSIDIIKNNYEKLNDKQRDLIKLNSKDITLIVPYDFTLIKNDRTFASISVLANVAPGVFDSVNMPNLMSGQESMWELKKKFEENLMVCDYRFAREYTKGQESSWLITELNQWTVADHPEEFGLEKFK